MDMMVDTSFCIDLMKEQASGTAGQAMCRLKELGDSGLAISVFSLCELKAGARMSRKAADELRRVDALETMLAVIYPDRDFSAEFGRVTAHLRRNGTPIPLMDLLIGVTALRSGLPILTADAPHFNRVPGLTVAEYRR